MICVAIEISTRRGRLHLQRRALPTSRSSLREMEALAVLSYDVSQAEEWLRANMGAVLLDAFGKARKPKSDGHNPRTLVEKVKQKYNKRKGK